jgi:dTDP-4-dehydrorhamnose reductase
MDAPAGLYHCVNSGKATWLEVAETLRQITGLAQAEIRAVRAADVVLAARRPQFAALSNEKLIALGIPMPPWRDVITRHFDRVGTVAGTLQDELGTASGE